MKTKINFRVSRPIIITLLAVFCAGLAACSKSSQTGNVNAVQNTTPSNAKVQQSPVPAVNPSEDSAAKALAVVETSFKDGKLLKEPPGLTNRKNDIESLYNKLKNKSGNLDISELGILDFFLYNSDTSAEERKKILNNLASFGGKKSGGDEQNFPSPEEVQQNKKLLETISKDLDDVNKDGKQILANLNSQSEGTFARYWKNAPLVLSSLTAFVLLVLLILKNLDIPSSNPNPVENAAEDSKLRRPSRGTNKTSAAPVKAGKSATNDSPETSNSESDLKDFLNLVKSDIANEVVAKLKPEINNIKVGSGIAGQPWIGSSRSSESTVENDDRANAAIYGQSFGSGNPSTIQKNATQAQGISFPSFVEEIERLNAPRLNYERLDNCFVESDNGNFYLINDSDGQNCIIPAVKYFMKKTDYIPFGSFYYQSGESEEDGRVRIDIPATVRKEDRGWRFTGDKGSLSVIA